MKSILTGLNENQARAVAWSGKPLLVLAGPGSGKTRVLTTRIARLLNESPSDSFRVLGLTFTHKAAEEMRARMRDLAPDQGRRAILTTFHAFATDVLRQHARHVGLKPDFRLVIHDSERKKLLARAIQQLLERGADVGSANADVIAPIDTILKQGHLPSEAARAFADRSVADRMAAIFTSYLEVLRQENASDFGSLLVFVRQLLEARPVIAKQLRLAYPHVCVDEFQDTNVAQYRLLRLISVLPDTDLFVVADDDQIIYAWNGASTDRLRALKQDFGVSILQLPENYRCPHDVVLLANSLIAHNSDRSEEKVDLAAIKEAGLPSVRVQRFATADDEVAWIAEDIRQRSDPGRCMILARTRKLLDLAVTSLHEAGVAGVITARKDSFASAPVLWLDALLRLICRPFNVDHAAALTGQFTVLEGVRSPSPDDVGVLGWIEAILDTDRIEPETRSFFDELRAAVSTGDFLTVIHQSFEWFEAIRTRSEPSHAIEWEAFDEEREIWRSHERDILERLDPAELNLPMYLQEFDLMPKVPAIGENTVRCSTIHLAKGLEFAHVYVMGLAEEQLPAFQAIRKGDTSAEMEEERRSCFVAITRCEDSLTLTFADEYFGWKKQPSRFLNEMGLEIPDAS